MQIECFRLLGEMEEAQALLNRVLKADSPHSIPQSVFEQQLRLALDQDEQLLMQSALQASENISGPGPQLELARLEVMMQLAARAGQPQNRQWLSAASRLTQSIENRHGGYWGRRAELILIGPAETNRTAANPRILDSVNGDSAELDLLIRLANNAMRNGRLEDAVKAFDRASQTVRIRCQVTSVFAGGTSQPGVGKTATIPTGC